MKRQLLRGIICVSAAIALSGCSSKADVKDNDNSTESTMVDVTTEETTKGMKIRSLRVQQKRIQLLMA